MEKRIQTSKFGTIYQSKSKMLEDIRLLLGLTPEELVSALTLLEKVDYGSLQFDRDNTSIRFQSSSSTHSIHSDISVEVQLKEDDVKHTVEYQIPRSMLKILRRTKRNKISDIVEKES
jgi:hypothetical protein